MSTRQIILSTSQKIMFYWSEKYVDLSEIYK